MCTFAVSTRQGLVVFPRILSVVGQITIWTFVLSVRLEYAKEFSHGAATHY
jgi:hypothetical protein